MAHRPHGLWATQVHLKQVEVATAEGYANSRELHQKGEKSQLGWRGAQLVPGGNVLQPAVDLQVWSSDPV